MADPPSRAYLPGMLTVPPPAAAVPEADIVLRDGSTLHVRPTTAEDAPRLRAFLASLSERVALVPLLQRRRQPRPRGPQAAAPEDGLSLIAVHGPEDTVVGHGTYVGAPSRAEVAFAVADAWQGHGIATILLAHLAQAASRPGSRPSRPWCCRRTGACCRSSTTPGSRSSVHAWTAAWSSSSRRRCRARRGARFEDRERAADVAAVAHVLRPASVAVIGASRRPGHRRRRGRPQPARRPATRGPLHLVNAKGGDVAGRPTVRSIADVEATSSSPSSPCPPPPSSRPRASAPRRACARSSSSRPGSPRSAPRAGAPGRAARGLPGRRHAAWSGRTASASPTSTTRPRSTRRSRPASRRPAASRFASQSGGVRHRRDRRGGGARHRALLVRVDGRQGRPLRQRLPASTGSRTPTPRCSLLYLESFGNPRRFGRIARRDHAGQADRGGQERPHGGRRARRVVAHRRAARGLRRHRRRAVRARRRAARRDGGGDVRRRGPARAPAAARAATASRC